MREGGGQRAEGRGQRTNVADAGRPCRIVDAEACFLDADACSRTQRPASLQNVERSVGLQALGPKMTLDLFGRRGKGR